MTHEPNPSAQTGTRIGMPSVLVLLLIAFSAGGGLSYAWLGSKAAPKSQTASSPAGPTTAAATPKPADGANNATGDDAVVAKVGDTVITEADLKTGAESLGEQLGDIPPAQLRPALIQTLIDLRVIALAAVGNSLDKSGSFVRLMDHLRERALRNEYFRETILPKATPERVRARYDTEIAKLTSPEEVKASHILVETEEEAKAIITELEGGADFATVAKEKSKDPGSGANGGDLGYFTKERMVPEFAEAAFGMQPGEMSKTPVKSSFGFHIIKVTDRRKQPPPPFEQVESQVRDIVLQDIMVESVEALRAATKIDILVSMDPAPALSTQPGPPEKPADAPAAPAPAPVEKAPEGEAPKPAQ